MNNEVAIRMARTLLIEVRNNLETQQRQLGDQADNAYFEGQFTQLFLIQINLNKLEVE
jgi:hypothetical protein